MLNVKELVDADLADRGLEVRGDEYIVLIKAATEVEMAFVEGFYELGVQVVAPTHGTLSEGLIKNLVRAALDEVLAGRAQVSANEFSRMWGET